MLSTREDAVPNSLMRAELEVSLLRPDPANPRRSIVGAGPTGELEQLADDAQRACDRATGQMLEYVIVLANHHAAAAAAEVPCR